MATYGYFPGCSLEATSKEFGASTVAVCEQLGIELREIPDWNCCGATSAHSTNRDQAEALAGRNLALAADAGHDTLVVPCAACYNRTRRTAHALAGDAARLAAVEGALGRRITKHLRVLHLLELLSAEEMAATLEGAVKSKLPGTKVAAYYGCLLLRPKEEMGWDDVEHPQSMDRLLSVCGAEPVEWHFRTECCGASLAIPQPQSVVRLVGNIVRNARACGAECIVTACPLCQVNLETRQQASPGEGPMPALYFTQILGVALGVSPAKLGIPRDSPILAAAAAAAEGSR